jgi:hypothetical protein
MQKHSAARRALGRDEVSLSRSIGMTDTLTPASSQSAHVYDGNVSRPDPKVN